MTTPERNIEEIVEELIDRCTDPETGLLHIEKYDHQFLEELLTQTLTAERQKREEVVEAERERILRELCSYGITPPTMHSLVLNHSQFESIITPPNK